MGYLGLVEHFSQRWGSAIVWAEATTRSRVFRAYRNQSNSRCRLGIKSTESSETKEYIMLAPPSQARVGGERGLLCGPSFLSVGAVVQRSTEPLASACGAKVKYAF